MDAELGRCGIKLGTSVRELGAELPIFLRKIRRGRRIAVGIIVGGEQVVSWCGEHGRIGHKFYRLGEAAGVGALEVDPVHGTLSALLDDSPLQPGLQLGLQPGMARFLVAAE